MDEICTDLAGEQAALDAVVADLIEDQWQRATPAAGWDVKDTIVHLVQADRAAQVAVADPERFAAAKAGVADQGLAGVFGDKSGRSGQEILAWWRDERAKMVAAFLSCGPKDRIPWFGPDMSARSFATARLMETWSHGQDVAEALGAGLPATDRLRHVAHLGVSTRGWSYVNRGREVPGADVRVELVGPSGESWTWGLGGVTDLVTGTALEFCLVVTQRRHLADTGLTVSGELATEWMSIAQAFAGPPTIAQADRKG
jgi:uncharacterized protein (TIGR03084 family)